MGDARRKALRAGELVIHVDVEEIARQPGEIDDMRLRDDQPPGLEPVPDAQVLEPIFTGREQPRLFRHDTILPPNPPRAGWEKHVPAKARVFKNPNIVTPEARSAAGVHRPNCGARNSLIFRWIPDGPSGLRDDTE
jgi:hypothetical protein